MHALAGAAETRAALPFITFDTVIMLTPASSATSRSVTRTRTVLPGSEVDSVQAQHCRPAIGYSTKPFKGDRRRPSAPGGGRAAGHHRDQWWRTAVIYQIYLRSFADGDGDGTGDLAGVRTGCRYLADLGVDAIWFTPWYLSPLADGGYDVADYRAIDPAFGTLAEAEALIAEAAELGIRTIVDVVPNHVSDQHAWFQEALAAGPGSPSANGSGSGTAGARRRRAADRPGVLDFGGAGLDPDEEPGRHARASGTCTCSPPSSPTSTGTTRRSGASTRTSCGSGSTAASPASGSTRPRCWSRTRRCPGAADASAG